jgi:hypothetical protein
MSSTVLGNREVGEKEEDNQNEKINYLDYSVNKW